VFVGSGVKVGRVVQNLKWGDPNGVLMETRDFHFPRRETKPEISSSYIAVNAAFAILCQPVN